MSSFSSCFCLALACLVSCRASSHETREGETWSNGARISHYSHSCAIRNREHPVFKAVFKAGPAGDITSAKMREEPEIADRMRDRFAATPDFDGKARVQADLAEALAKSVATRDALDDAETAENKAGDAELLARIGVRTVLEQAYGKLRTAFPGQRKLVESFFYRPERRAKKAASDDSGDTDGN